MTIWADGFTAGALVTLAFLAGIYFARERSNRR